MEGLAILVLDHDPETLAFLMQRFRRANDSIFTCSTSEELSAYLRQRVPDVVVLSSTWTLHPLEVLEEMKRSYGELPVIMVSNNGGVPEAVEAMKRGARDYLVKPLDQSGLEKAVLQAAREYHLLKRVNRLQTAYHTRGQFEELVGISPAMQQIYKTIEHIAYGDATVLITGESGVGKELAARAIHRRSLRRDKPFVAINCANIPKDLLENELFGHDKGAFTGAATRQTGRCHEAHHGTLFLDEICEIDYDLQAKLLRFLQEKTFRPLGSSHLVEVDIRVICATNRNPLQEIQKGRLREDLYYRIAVIPLEIPPLRHRKEDIPILAMKFLGEFSARYDKYFYDFSPEAMERLIAYPWPGNVRELRNTIEQVVALSTGAQVFERFLPESIRTYTPTPRKGMVHHLAQKEPPHIQEIIPLRELERHTILRAIEMCRGNMREAAQRLGLGQATLYRKAKKYGLRA